MENNPFFDLYIDEGTSFSIFLDVFSIEVDELTGKETTTPIDLSGVTSVAAVIRKNYKDDSPVLATFSCYVTSESLGEIGISLSKNDTLGLYDGPEPVYHLGYYDVIITNGFGTKTKLVGGKVYLNQTVTR